MRKHLTTLAGAAVLALALAPAAQAQSRSWLVCGGNTFATCASVSISLTATATGHNVTVKVWNLSGNYGTWQNTVFTYIGFDNIGTASYAGGLSVTGPMRAGDNLADAAAAWSVSDDKSVGGGINLDVVAGTGNPDGSIASGCYDNSLTPALPGGSNDLFMNPCAYDPGNASGWVTISFKTTGTWNLDNAVLLVKGQNGVNGQSTECITGTNCSVVPEPITLTLLATGLAGVGGIGAVRRKRQKGEV